MQDMDPLLIFIPLVKVKNVMTCVCSFEGSVLGTPY